MQWLPLLTSTNLLLLSLLLFLAFILTTILTSIPFFSLPKVQLLDTIAGQKAQLSPLEFLLLCGSVLASASGPLIFNGEITEFLAPAAAACTSFYSFIRACKLCPSAWILTTV